MGNVLLTLSLCIIAANALFDLAINCWSWWRRLSYTPEIHEVSGFEGGAQLRRWMP